MHHHRTIVATLALALFANVAAAMPPAASVDTLLEADETVIGQEFQYPQGRAKITAAIVTVPPGARLATHLHPVPLFAYILKGVLVVDYGSAGERIYRRGDSLVEAIDWPHSGRNGGRGNVKILVVYSGAEGVPISIPADAR